MRALVLDRSDDGGDAAGNSGRGGPRGAARLALDRNYPDPAPGPGEALVRPIRVGICSSDVELVRCRTGCASVTASVNGGGGGGDGHDSACGMNGCRGAVLGHEFVGVIESINGPDPRRLTGKRVVGGASIVCGRCDLCRRGLTTHCRRRVALGRGGRDGCFAEAFAIPEKNVIEIPDAIDDDEAVFAEPLAAAIHGAQQLHIEGKPYITVLGDGPLGLLSAQVMARLNASVRVVGRHPEKMNLCEKWGVRHRHVDDVGRRADQDIVVDCTGSPTGLELAMKLVRPRGKILLKTIAMRSVAHDAPCAIDLSPIVMNEIELIGSRCGSIADAIAFLRQRQVDVISLISRRYRLDDGVKAFRAAEERGVIKVLMDV